MAIMNTQKRATARNAQAEVLSDYILRLVATELSLDVIPRRQVPGEAALTSDIWDHRLGEVWAQTTCYRTSGEPEPNKTYELRETVIEALALRAEIGSPEGAFRSVHITYGNPDFTYRWFRPVKATAFDRSIFINLAGEDIYVALNELLADKRTKEDRLEALASVSHDSPFGRAIDSVATGLAEWWRSGCPPEPLADMQAQLIRDGRPSKKALHGTLQRAHGSGLKEAALSAMSSDTQSNRILGAAIGKVEAAKPFLANARSQVSASGWPEFTAQVRGLTQGCDLATAIRTLWSAAPADMQPSLRRILIRVHAEDGGVDYAVADFNVPGVTEHTLYAGEHSEKQVSAAVSAIQGRLKSAGITSQSELNDAIRQRGRKILRGSLQYERANGTMSTFSKYAVLETLKQSGHKVQTPSQAGIDATGYHAQLAPSAVVRPYSNLTAVQGKPGTTTLVKIKHFSAAEFARRAKEDAYVGLTLSYKYDGIAFVRQTGRRLIMCIDMPVGFKPPSSAVELLMACGWEIAWGPEDLIDMLGN